MDSSSRLHILSDVGKGETCRTLFHHDSNKDAEAKRMEVVIAEVFRRHEYPFETVAVEKLFSLIEQMQMQLPHEEGEMCPTSSANCLHILPSAAFNTGDGIHIRKIEDLLQRWRWVHQLASEHHKLQLMVKKLQEAQAEERQALQRLREENEALKELGLSGFVSAVQELFLSPTCGSTAEEIAPLGVGSDDGMSYDHVSVVVLPEDVSKKGAQRPKSMEVVDRFMSAQRRRGVEYLLHVLQAVYLENQQSQARCTALQAKLDATELQQQKQPFQPQAKTDDEIESLRVALEKERVERTVLLQKLTDITRMQAEAAGRKKSVATQMEEKKDGIVARLSSENMMRDNGKNDPSSSECVPFTLKSPMSSSLAVAPASEDVGALREDISSTLVVSSSSATHESNLERLAREVIAPLSNTGGSMNVPLILSSSSSSVFAGSSAVTFSRPSASSLEIARHLVGLECNDKSGNCKKGGPLVSLRSCGGTSRRESNVGGGGGDGGEHALRLLQRLVPDGGSTLFDISVAVYEGVHKLATRCRRATEEAQRHGKRLCELEAVAAKTLQLQEETQRQQKLLSVLHCRAEKKEEVVDRLKGRLNATRAEAAKLRQKLDEYQSQVGQQREDALGEKCSTPPHTAGGHRPLRKGSKPVVREASSLKKKRKKDDIFALARERARADEAEKELTVVQNQLRAANDELVQGKHFLLCLLQDGEKEFERRMKARQHAPLMAEQTVGPEEEEGGRRGVVTVSEEPLAMGSPEPIPPSPLTTLQGGGYVVGGLHDGVGAAGGQPNPAISYRDFNTTVQLGMGEQREKGIAQESISAPLPDEWSGANKNVALSKGPSWVGKKNPIGLWKKEIVTDNSHDSWGSW